MKNFSTFYSRIDKVIETRSSKKERGKGLLSSGKVAQKRAGAEQQDIHEKIADYVEAIRNQKKGFLNGD